MKFALAKEHREFYAHNHYIEFEGLISSSEMITLQEAVTGILAQRLKPSSLSSRTPHELYLVGRDLWRSDPAMQKIVLKRSLAEIAAELFKHELLRIAFDQYQDETFPLSLQQMSSLSPLLGVVALPLENNDKGRAIYFSATEPMILPFFEGPLLLIAYTGNKTQYTLKKDDLHTHAVKRLGYAFGDLIKNETHPIVYR